MVRAYIKGIKDSSPQISFATVAQILFRTPGGHTLQRHVYLGADAFHRPRSAQRHGPVTDHQAHPLSQFRYHFNTVYIGCQYKEVKKLGI